MSDNLIQRTGEKPESTLKQLRDSRAEENTEVELTTLPPGRTPRKSSDDDILLFRKLQQGAGSRLDSDTIRNYVPTQKNERNTVVVRNSNGQIEQKSINAGGMIQKVYSETKIHTTTSNNIPSDDTIPQNTEGEEILTATITPTNANSRLLFNVSVFGSANAGDPLILALFQDSTADAIAAVTGHISSSGALDCIVMQYEMVAGTTSATTFKVRVGTSTSTAAINGTVAERKFGGVGVSSMTITEIQV